MLTLWYKGQWYCSSLTSRSAFPQFPTGTETFAIVIERTFREELDWTVFRDPFSAGLWKFLALYSLLCALCVRMVQYVATKEARSTIES